MTTLAEIKQKLADIRQELAEVSLAIEQLEGTPAPLGQQPTFSWPATIRFADKEPVGKALVEVMRQAGLDHVEPIAAEALQERMCQAGIKPEDNLFSRGILEMREE